MRQVVLETNVVLDLLVFADPGAMALRAALERGALRWLATAAMRDELEHVLAYPQFVKRIADAQCILHAFDAQAHAVGVAPVAPVVCKDPDDQKFIDLAVAHEGMLISKDNQVLRLRRKLALLNVEASAIYS
jgi:putative PIN family toxin of toxin-antitoxin system